MNHSTTAGRVSAARQVSLQTPALQALIAFTLRLLRVEVLSRDDQVTRRAVREAAAVRALAKAHRTWSPNYASDLDAAADRHESAVAAMLEARR